MSESMIWSTTQWVQRTTNLLNSYRKFVGRELIARDHDPLREAEAVFFAPFVVVAHGTETDPILNYANFSALQLWDSTPEELLKMPSRYTAEPQHREERAELLAQTSQHGFFDGYRGTRITCSGRRFEIKSAVIWNVVDEYSQPNGQAATFSDWFYLPDSESPLEVEEDTDN